MSSAAQLPLHQRLVVTTRRSRSTAVQSSSIRSESQHTAIWVITSYSAGRLEEADAAFRKALELNPQFPGTHRCSGPLLFDAIQIRRSTCRDPERTGARWRAYRTCTCLSCLRKEEGSRCCTGGVSLTNFRVSAAFQIAQIYAYRGETDKAFEWLERAYKQRDGGLSEMKGDPLLRSLERDPRWTAFLKKMKLPVD